MGRLKNEIKQERPFGSLEEEVFLNLQRTSDALARRVAETLKQVELTPTQYNALRILRGAGERGLPCKEVGDRMVTRDPDITRLFDRLETWELIERSRNTRDRRVIIAHITERGETLLDTIDSAVSRVLVGQLEHLGRERLLALNRLLEDARIGDG